MKVRTKYAFYCKSLREAASKQHLHARVVAQKGRTKTRAQKYNEVRIREKSLQKGNLYQFPFLLNVRHAAKGKEELNANGKRSSFSR